MLRAATLREFALRPTRKTLQNTPLAFIHTHGHRLRSDVGTSPLTVRSRRDCLQSPAGHRRQPSAFARAGQNAQFHASPRREGISMVALLASVLKVSQAMRRQLLTN